MHSTPLSAENGWVALCIPQEAAQTHSHAPYTHVLESSVFYRTSLVPDAGVEDYN